MSACVISDDMVYVASILDENNDNSPLTRFFLYEHSKGDNKSWYYHDQLFNVASVCFLNSDGDKKLYALSEEGELEVFDGQEGHSAFIHGSGLTKEWSYQQKGYLTTIRNIEGCLFACGFAAQIYTKSEKWMSLDHGFDKIIKNYSATEDFDEDEVSIIDICQRNPNEYFCVGRIGDYGFIANYVNGEWHLLPRRIQATLYSIILLDNNLLIACGVEGNIFEINHNNDIKSLVNISIHEDFYSLSEYKGGIFIGSSCGLYALIDGELSKVNIDSKVDNELIFKVESSENILWVFSNKYLCRMEGGSWELIENPDNNVLLEKL